MGGSGAAVLGTVCDDVDGEQLQGRYVDDKKGAHCPAGGGAMSVDAVQLLKCEEAGAGAGVAQAQEIGEEI